MLTDTTESPALELNASRQLTSWMAEQCISFVFTTYQTGKLFLIGLQPDGRLSVFERTFNRCMGLTTTDNGFYLSSLYQLWFFENVLSTGQTHEGYDRLYVPQFAYTTGDVDCHDIAVDEQGQVWFVNTLFSCLANPSMKYSFSPRWQPPFISKLAAEDRCHLNGLALRDGKPRYVTMVGQADVADGWRQWRQDGGLVMDVVSNEVIGEGLSMPHSPRWHQGKLWLLDSGQGQFGSLNLTSGKFEPLCFCPGYARGLSFHGDYAMIGLSQPRHNKTFADLPLTNHMNNKGAAPRCGVQIVDLRTGDMVHWLTLEGVVQELYDVAILPGVMRPMALGFKTDEIRRVITLEPDPA